MTHRPHLPAFCKDRRGAIAVIFAIALLSLAMMVGLSIDTAFYAQAKSQIGLAADAAATHAIRAATSTYQMETAESPPVSQTQAQADGIAAGETAGLLWFHAQLGNLPTATLAGITDPNIVVTPITSVAAGFTANVTYNGQYPTFFGGLFRNKKAWAISGTSTAQTAFDYIEVLMMLDTSGSMFIGALPADINTLDDWSVCIPDNASYNFLNNVIGIPDIPQSSNGHQNSDQYNKIYNSILSKNGNTVDFNAVLYYNQNLQYYEDGTCANQNQALNQNPLPQKGNFGPLAPCAFACHTTNSTAADGYTQDLYGIARRVQARNKQTYILKEDYVLAATEDVLSQLIQNQQGQFSVGIYQFNDNVSPIVRGTIGVDSLTEATSDLKTALKKVSAVDYNLTPTETVIPPLITAAANGMDPATDYTDFADSMNNLLNGTNDNMTPLAANSTTAGLKPSTPQRDLFIVTDGLEDSLGAGPRMNGEMTSFTSEDDPSHHTGLDAPVCYPYKNVGFTVYVLYVPYNRVPNQTYYQAYYAYKSTPWTDTDYPTLANAGGGDYSGGTLQDYVEGTSGMTTAPDMAALEACASSPSDFFIATDSSQIDSKMNAMLQSALTTSIRLIQ